ncbi:hypothetical protein [Falsiporphyromonas endometrii]|uniref:Uncharacterized protein n=1 Tax=Falsiporphyromonas endometrii TaxID=1387297 RepID=A0ABV9K5W6_9PORP
MKIKNYLTWSLVALLLFNIPSFGASHLSSVENDVYFAKVTTTKRTKATSNRSKFTLYVSVVSPSSIIVDWGDTKIDTIQIDKTSPNDPQLIRRHFQDGKKIHTVTIKGEKINSFKSSSQSISSIEFEDAKELETLTLNNEAITSLDLSMCNKLVSVDCSKNKLSELTIPNTVLKLNCSNNLLSFGNLPPINPGMKIEDYSYESQGEWIIPTERINKNIVNLSSETNIKGVSNKEEKTLYSWIDSEGNIIPSTSYTEENGIFIFKKIPETKVKCQLKSLAFPSLTIETAPISIESGSSTDNSETYRFGYSYGEPSKKGSEKAGGSIFYAAGPLFLNDMLSDFKGDKAVGLRVYLHQPYQKAKVFLRNGIDKKKGFLAQKEVDLKQGWNDIYFDSPVELPQDSLLAAYFIKTSNKNDIVLAGDYSVRDKNDLWEMIQDANETSNPSADFYEGTWINSSKVLPAAPVQILLKGDESHFINRLTVVGFYPPFYGEMDNQGYVNVPILLANMGLNKIETVSITYSFDNNEPVEVSVPVNLEAYGRSSKEEGGHPILKIPYSDTNRHLVSLSMNKLNGNASVVIKNPKWSQLTQGYHSANVYPRTVLIEGLMSENDPFSANAEKTLTSLLNPKNWHGKNVARMDYHYSLADRNDMYALPEIFFNDAVGHLAIMDNSDNATIVPSLMVDRDIMTSYAQILYKGSPFLPVLNYSTLSNLLMYDAFAAPGFAEISLFQKRGEVEQSTSFDIEGVISKDVVNKKDLCVTVAIVERDLIGSQMIFDTFSNEVVTNNAFIHAPTIRTFISNPSGDKIDLNDKNEFKLSFKNVRLDGFKKEKCSIIAFVHHYNKESILGNEVLNTTIVTVDDSKFVPTSNEKICTDKVTAYIDYNGTLIINGEYKKAFLYDLNGIEISQKDICKGNYVLKIITTNNDVIIRKIRF